MYLFSNFGKYTSMCFNLNCEAVLFIKPTNMLEIQYCWNYLSFL